MLDKEQKKRKKKRTRQRTKKDEDYTKKLMIKQDIPGISEQ